MSSGGGALLACYNQSLKNNISDELKGNSGCKLLLCGNTSNIFVRKISNSLHYNIRLKKQFLKQKYFSLNGIKVPEILNYGYIDGKFYFDMQYIRSRTFAECIEHISLQQVDKLNNFLMSILPLNAAAGKQKSKKAFDAKIESLLPYCYENLIYKKAILKLQNFDFSNVPNSYCCGDLTLENILISNEGNIYLIDFLDSFYNSWMIDIAKLLQDIDLNWSYRNETMSVNKKIRLLIIKQKILDDLSKLHGGEYICLAIYHILLLNVLRIIPYCKDQKTYEFIQQALHKTLNSIKEMEM